MTLEVIFDNDFDVSESLVLALKNAADLTLQEEKKRDSVVNLKIVGNAEMQQLNKEFRNKDRATNVLSFTNDDLSKDVTKNIGDIAISYDFVKQEAKDHGKSFSDHVIQVLEDTQRIGMTHFSSNDVVRHPLVRKIIDAYQKFEKNI